MTSVLFFITLLCIALLPFALAQPVYWTIVADDGTAADVVNAANLAASMKASVDVSFTGKTESQVADTDQDPTTLLTIHLQGSDAEIAYGTDPAFSTVVDVAQRYLEEQGFTVSVTSGVDTAAPARAPPRSMPVPDGLSPEDPTPVLEEQLIVARQPVDVGIAPDAAAPVADPGPTGAKERAEEPNVFTRLWRWFVSLIS